MDDEIDGILEEQGIDKSSLETSLELARLFAAETNLCCKELGLFTWACYQQLVEEDRDEGIE